MDKNFPLLFSQPLYLGNPVSAIAEAAMGLYLKTPPKSEIDFLSEIKSVTIETSVTSETPETSVKIIPLQGVVRKYGYGSTTFLSDLLASFSSDEAVAGVVFLTDSPGGMASGTGALADKIKKFPKPTAAFINGYSCSAAYYLNAAADHIFADKNADDIGSIGVLCSFVDYIPLLEKLGAKYHEVYAPQSTDKNLSFRELLAGNDEKMKAEIAVYAENFINDVKRFRPQITDEAVFKGGKWQPKEALKLGLIDEIGSLQDAVNFIFETQNSKLVLMH